MLDVKKKEKDDLNHIHNSYMTLVRFPHRDSGCLINFTFDCLATLNFTALDVTFVPARSLRPEHKPQFKISETGPAINSFAAALLYPNR